jgi:plasmid maintenance system antidote protein VapI
MKVRKPADPKTPAKFQHKGVQGARLPGWPDLNCEALARTLKCHPMHLRSVLSGRIGTTLRYIERLAEALDLSAPVVVTRIIEARDADQQRLIETQQRWVQRQIKRGKPIKNESV